MRNRLVLALLFGAALAVTAAAQTQITTGVIQGTVTDATGAVLPGVTVEARSTTTNVARTAVTVTVSATAEILMGAASVTAWPMVSTRFSCTRVANPDSV